MAARERSPTGADGTLEHFTTPPRPTVRLHRQRSLIGPMFTVWLLGCTPAAPEPDIPLEAFAAPYAHARCETMRNCYDDVPTAYLLATATADGCEPLLRAQFENRDLPRYQAAIEMGTLTYVEANAAACIDSLVPRGCALFASGVTPECAALFRGNVPVDGACALDEECAPDAYCDLSSSCPGRCRARSAEGYGCERIADCASGLICGPDQLCIPPVALVDRCTETSQCASGMLCVDGLSGRQCVPPHVLYEPVAVALCGRGHAWVCGVEGWACMVPGLAIPCNPHSLLTGRACHPGVPDPCPGNQYCADAAPSMGDVDGTCAALPTDGMACIPVLGRPGCADGNVCEGGTCVAMHTNGESCTTSADCYGANCEGGTCTAPTYCP